MEDLSVGVGLDGMTDVVVVGGVGVVVVLRVVDVGDLYGKNRLKEGAHSVVELVIAV